MQNTLRNPNPEFYLERGQKCYLAIDNANGGDTVIAIVTGKDKADVEGRACDAYRIAYHDSLPPFQEHEDTVLVHEVFTSLYDMAEARRKDDSLQLANIRGICSTPQGLVRYLLDNAVLAGDVRKTVRACAEDLGLA